MILSGPRPEAHHPAIKPEDLCLCGHSRYAHEGFATLSFRPRLGPCVPEREVAAGVDTDSPCACMRFVPSTRLQPTEPAPLKKRGKKDGSAVRGRKPEQARCRVCRAVMLVGDPEECPFCTPLVEDRTVKPEHRDPPVVDRPVKRRPVPEGASPYGRFSEVRGTVAFVQNTARRLLAEGWLPDEIHVEASVSVAQVMRDLIADGYQRP